MTTLSLPLYHSAPQCRFYRERLATPHNKERVDYLVKLCWGQAQDNFGFRWNGHETKVQVFSSAFLLPHFGYNSKFYCCHLQSNSK